MDDGGNNTTISAKIAEMIKRQIADGTLRPGDRLPAERELALELGVARSPLREALRELKTQGYLEAGGGRQRTVVASLADARITDPLARLLQADTGRFVDLIELRQGLEVQAAGLAATRRKSADIAAFRRILSAMEALGNGDRHESAKLDAAFHGTLANATHNVFFMHVTAELVRLLHENIPAILDILYTQRRSSQELLQQHSRIVDAIEGADEEGARAAMMAHLDYVLRGLGRGEREDGSRAGRPSMNTEPPTPRWSIGPSSVLDRDLVD